ncbi:MAG TPA: GrpB family protein [Anaerolineales bacterium]|nr:GrpB family protein [Anaerolineales bacterium]HRF50477.1 GrpB family protein [Anaerolineales bacterium]
MPPIVIVPYRADWPAEFQDVARDLRRILGVAALRIDHIGSTSVPGLAAKDIIDVQVTVADLVSDLSVAMTTAGYQAFDRYSRDHVPPGMDPEPAAAWAKLFFRPGAGARPANIHIRVAGRPNQRFALLFRDYLRANPPSAAAYAELKRRLAAQLADPAMYPDVKDPAVDQIYFAAEAWAAAVGWAPGPADA